MPAITITDPPDGFDLSGSYLPVFGTSDLTELTVRINTTLYRVVVSGGTWHKVVDVPPSDTPSDVTIEAFDGFTYETSTVFSNVVHGQAVNIPAPPIPYPPEEWWVDEGYETIVQSEASLFNSDPEKTVRAFSLDFYNQEDPTPLLCHSQIGVGGLPACIDWWPSEPWPIQCKIHSGEATDNHRDTGPMTWPYYATGRYVSWRIYVSSQPTEEVPTITFKPKGGVVDFLRTKLSLSLSSECL